MKVRDYATFVAFAVMMALALTYIRSLGVIAGPPSDRTSLSMQVADINSLVVDSNVLLRGVQVGKVTNIESTLMGANIDFYIDDRYRVPVDTEVRLENLSALGESYIGLIPQSGGGPMLQDGQHIATERVVQPASIAELTTGVVRVLHQADPDALKRIVTEVDIALPDPNTVLPNVTHASTLLRNVTSDMQGRGRDLLDNFQTLLQNAGWLGPSLARLTPSLQQLAPALGDTISAFITPYWLGAPKFLADLNRYLDRIQKFLDDNGGDLKVLGEAMLPHLKGIAGSLMNFDTGQILSNLMATVPSDGAVTLHVSLPPR